MELPLSIRSLYRHWGSHVETGTKSSPVDIPEELAWFVDERMKIWEKKTLGEAPPYTENPILQKYRFCNIFREFDRQTIELHTMLNPIRNDFALWLLNMFAGRLIARPETLREIGLLSFDPVENALWKSRLLALSKPRYGTPYVFPVSVIMRTETATREAFMAEYMPSVIQEIATTIEDFEKLAVYDGLERVLKVFGLNLSFLWTEVLIDVAYQHSQYLDLFGRFPIGPGAMPTLKRLGPDQDPSLLVKKLAAGSFESRVTIDGKPLRISAENWEGIACEFRKYINLKNGEGRKRRYS